MLLQAILIILNKKSTVRAKSVLPSLVHHDLWLSEVNDSVLCLDRLKKGRLYGVDGLCHVVFCFQNLNYKLQFNDLSLNTGLLDILN